MKKNAIVDTNIFLHWDVQNVDWCSELHATEVEIIVCRTVLRELDRKKEGANSKLADRARKCLSLIESLDASGKPLRENVRIVVLAKEPKIEWEKVELDPDVEDDRIIAAILERHDVDDVLITDDATPRITARKKKLAVQELQTPKLPEPKSDLEKDLERARREILELKNTIPVLVLRLDPPSAKDSLATFPIVRPRPITEGAVKALVVAREEALSAKAANISASRIAHPMLGIDIQGYMSDIKAHLVEYEKYLKQKDAVEQKLAGVIPIRFALACEGNVPADDVRCVIRFPAKFTLLKEYEVIKMPREPDTPVPMPRLSRLLISAPNLGSLSSLGESIYEMRSTRPNERQSSEVVERNKVSIWLRKLQHGFLFNPGTVHVKLPPFDDLQTFEIEFDIFAANLPKSVKGTIPVKLQLDQQ